MGRRFDVGEKIGTLGAEALITFTRSVTWIR